MKDIWRPTVWDRTPYDVWLAGGKKGALEKATEIADDILANYRPEPLPDDVVAELARIVAARRRRALRVSGAASTAAEPRPTAEQEP